MARRYRAPTPGERDARAERRVARLEELGFAPREALPPRPIGRLFLSVDGQEFDLRLAPDPRNCRAWIAWWGDEVFARGGLEKIFREVQRRRVPRLGERNLL